MQHTSKQLMQKDGGKTVDSLVMCVEEAAHEGSEETDGDGGNDGGGIAGGDGVAGDVVECQGSLSGRASYNSNLDVRSGKRVEEITNA